jgi:chlorobactene glucosyltransferase
MPTPFAARRRLKSKIPPLKWTVPAGINLAVSLGVALGLARNLGRAREIAPVPWPADQPAPEVAIIVPLRDERANVDPLLASLTQQQYPAYAIIAVDDGSTDGTGAALAAWAARDPRVRVVHGVPLRSGWTGKNHALWQGVREAIPPGAAAGGAPWLLFVDADTRHHPLMLASAVAEAERTGADLLTLLPRLDLGSFWERVLVPHAGELYTLLVGGMAQVNNPRSPVASANGQWLRVRRAAYLAVGGQVAVRGEIAEDRALARRMKGAGYRLHMVFARRLVWGRAYAGLAELWRGFGKTLYPASGRSVPRVLATVGALTVYGLAPWGQLAWGVWQMAHARPTARRTLGLAALQLVPQLAIRAALARYLGLSPAYALTYPLAVLLGNALLLHSAWRYRSGRGMLWKGRRMD